MGKSLKNSTLLKTNLLVCTIITIGFTIASVISYQSNFGIYQKDMEMVSALSSEGLYNEISSIFSQPVSVSLTMANDSLLKGFLIDEKNSQANDDWQNRMKEYLRAYREKYEYDSVFLVSTTTNNYYHFAGLDRTLTKGNAENDWYYDFLSSEEEYSLNVDNDEATDDSITVFVNCKIKDREGNIAGIVGVGMKVNSLQELLSSYEENYGVHVYLVDDEGTITLSSSLTGHEKVKLQELAGYKEHAEEILSSRDTKEQFWYAQQEKEGHVVSRYETNLKWHLIVENNTASANAQFTLQLYRNIFIIALIIILVMIIITTVIKRYNAKISELSVSQELEYQRLLHEMTIGLYENVYEFDITHNCAGSEPTKKYFESLSITRDTPYDQALFVIANKQIKEEYIQGYLDTYSPTSIYKAYEAGITNLSYDLMMSTEGSQYHWIRISARIFFFSSDGSIRMITYRENIDSQKKQELKLLEGIQRDQMTGLYNKKATEELITSILDHCQTHGTYHAFLIFDIDNFKQVNDQMGHQYGDHVIHEFASEIKTQFTENDIVGRIGGDEFVVFINQFDHLEGLKQKLKRICKKLEQKDFHELKNIKLSCSIGVSLFPQDGVSYSTLYEQADQALYYAKSHGKNSYRVYSECLDSQSFHANQRDLETLVTVATDGLAQFACTDPITLLYFNQKCVDLFGIPASVLSSPNFDAFSIIHPEEIEEVKASLAESAKERRPFARTFRIRHQTGTYMKVEIKGIFISELYKQQYPIFYIMYLKQS